MIEALARRTRKRQFDVACLAFGVGRSSSFHYFTTPLSCRSEDEDDDENENEDDITNHSSLVTRH